MRNVPIFLLLGALATTAAGAARGGEFEHVGDDELTLEIEARAGDVARTTERIAALDAELAEARGALEETRVELAEVERQLGARAALLYRLTQHGEALRYLLTAESATGFLKRLTILRALVVRDLDERRRIGRELVEAEDRVTALGADRRAADELLVRLTAAQAELLAERDRRAAPPLLSWR